MEVILLEKIDNLGGLGDRVTVRSGFARNYLLPQGKAKFATAENIAEFEARRAELEKAAAEALAAAEARKAQLEGTVLEITAKSGGEGKLFGSIGPADIADALTAKGTEVEKKEVRMPEGPLRTTGEFEIGLHLHTDVDVDIHVVVIGEE
ncbi:MULTISPECIES: 50S ribosomal protein L9 [unclassified Thioalkalivibrio]|jgi:large subunit ribosomal protein L9|uniref:50S ribosomal protein L9 n=1 Tax=unclassified Thioalkalivibrio TaxID=2621013 RepID=UPI0001959FA1|nr:MULTISPECIES: 50S ribosomal protein L9 [unclassified Thioalkalivibrio]ADC72423.1 ribosomal protein L9 [Thioalkalivibrio sp. K90mix]